jgi:hypothetical protein
MQNTKTGFADMGICIQSESPMGIIPASLHQKACIMDTFPIVRRRDEAKQGEYRTKRVILEIYDEMAEAMRTGIPYKTRLVPPPADPRCCHPPKKAEVA